MDRLDMNQTWHGMAWHGMNRLDSPIAGYNINTRPGTKATTWLLIANKTGHMKRTNQSEHDKMNKRTNQNVTQNKASNSIKTWGKYMKTWTWQNPKQTIQIPSLWAALDALMQHPPQPKHQNIQESEGLEVVQGVGWRARPMKRNRRSREPWWSREFMDGLRGRDRTGSEFHVPL